MLLSGFLGFHDELGGAAPNFKFKDLMQDGSSFADVANVANTVPATRLINCKFTGCRGFDQLVFGAKFKIVLESGTEGVAAQAFADRQAAAMEALLKADPDAPRRAMLAWQDKYLQGP